jgi:hypothetical protein
LTSRLEGLTKMMTAHTRRTPHHQPNNLASMVPVNEQELSSNNLRHRYEASSSSSKLEV